MKGDDDKWTVAVKEWDDISVGHECEKDSNDNCKCNDQGDDCKRELGACDDGSKLDCQCGKADNSNCFEVGMVCVKDDHSACKEDDNGDWTIAAKEWDEIEVGHECEKDSNNDCKCDDDGKNCKKEEPSSSSNGGNSGGGNDNGGVGPSGQEYNPIEENGICEKKNYMCNKGLNCAKNVKNK